MPPEARILGLGAELPERELANRELAQVLGEGGDAIAQRTGVGRRFQAAPGEGPSALALRAAQRALSEARTEVSELGLIIFATTTPDICFPGAACLLQHKLGAPTVGAMDVRAQSAGFLCALDLAVAYATTPVAPGAAGADPRYARVLVAAGEVMSSGLDMSPSGSDLTPRFGDGAAAAIVGPGEHGPRVRALRWYTDGTRVEQFWCEYPASRQYPHRVTREDLRAGKHFPRADLAALAGLVRERLAETSRQVLSDCGLAARELDAALVDYVVPSVARDAAADVGVEGSRVGVPTADFGHVLAGGLAIGLEQRRAGLARGARVLLAAAGPGLSWGAAVLEF